MRRVFFVLISAVCLLAVCLVLNLNAGASRGEVETALKNHIIGTAETMGRYEKQ